MSTENDEGSGARRATYLPPATQGVAAPAPEIAAPSKLGLPTSDDATSSNAAPSSDSTRNSNGSSYDDDVLASAMNDESLRLGLTGAIEVINPVTDTPVFATRRSLRNAEQALSNGRTPSQAAASSADPDSAPASASAFEPAPGAEPAAAPATPRVYDLVDPLRHSVATPDSVPNQPVAESELSSFAAHEAALPEQSVIASGAATPNVALPNFAEPSSPELNFAAPTPVIEQAPALDALKPQGSQPIAAPINYPAQAVAASRSVPDFESFDQIVDNLQANTNLELQAPAPEPAVAPATAVAPPNAAASTVADDRVVSSPSRFSPETSGAEPTPLDQRVGRATRLFWIWFAANSSIVSLALGALIFSLGMSLRQAIIATIIGVAISFLPLGLGTLAGKWSGQPVMIVSRATFGHLGNILPTIIALLGRLFWGGVLLWIIAVSTARVLLGAKLSGGLTELQIMLLVALAGFLLSLFVTYFGYALIVRIQLAFGILSAVFVAGFVFITWPAVDFSTARSAPDGPVLLILTGAVLVFSLVGLTWANSSGDMARYQRPSSSGGATMVAASWGATLPAFVLIGYGTLLAASSSTIGRRLFSYPVDGIAALLPSWYPLPLIAAVVSSLLAGVIMTVYSGGFSLLALGARIPRTWATFLSAVFVFAITIALGFGVKNIAEIFRDLATTLAVPVAAWTGIFGAEMIMRKRRFDTESLIKRGGFYSDVNWVNLSMLVVATVIGFGFITAEFAGLGWEGFLFTALGVPHTSVLGSTDIGVFVALGLGLLTPFTTGWANIRRQELVRVARP